MELKNTTKAMELIPTLEKLQRARKLLSDIDCHIEVIGKYGEEELPCQLRMNVLNAVNYEYERVRKEISEL